MTMLPGFDPTEGVPTGPVTLPQATAPQKTIADLEAERLAAEIALTQAQTAKLGQPPTFAPAQPDPDLAAKQQFQRELETSRQQVERELAGLDTQRRLEEQQRQQQFQGAEQERNRAVDIERNRITLLEQQQRAANDQAMRALESGRLDESKRQFDLSQSLARQRFELEQQTAQRDYETAQSEMAFGVLKFLTDLSRNPRTALASFFLNRGLQPPNAVGETSPVPAGLNVTNVAETLPRFLQGIMGAARGASSPAGAATATAAPASTSFTPQTGGNIVQSLTQAGAVPPFLSRILAQSQGIPEQGTNTSQTGTPPEGVPLVSSLALLQMSPSEREGLRGVVEAGGMSWEDYLDLIQRASPQQRIGTEAPNFSFIPQ